MSDLNVIIRDRGDDKEIPQRDVDYAVEQYSFAAIGGPKLARIKVMGDDRDLWEMVQNLRSPVRIYAKEGDSAWWGLLTNVEATVRAGAVDAPLSGNAGWVRVGASLDTWRDRVAVAYSKVDTGTGSIERDTVDFDDVDGNANDGNDLVSQSEYGVHELLWSSSAATRIHAEAARYMKLQQVRYPQAKITLAERVDEPTAMLTCSGWWDTLGWQYYGNAGTAAVDTATQCGTILATKGQFFETIHQDVESGIVLREERDGDATALFEVLELLKTGTDNHRRLLAKVDEYRNVTIYEEPAVTRLVNQLLADGSVNDAYGSELRKSIAPKVITGKWSKWKDVIPANVSTILLIEPSLVFVEECEYDAGNDRLLITPRGDLDTWDFPVTKDG